jgi:hypothetical protein
MSPESPETTVQPVRERLRALYGALIILALAVVLAVMVFCTVCTGFRWYDDMGALMLIEKTLVAGHPLYDQTFTLYGPAYYAWQEFLHTITRLPLSHDSTLLFTTGSLIGISLLCAGYVARMTRNVFPTALTCFTVCLVLGVLRNEPGHPQELCSLLLGGMLLAASFLTTGPRREIILGVMGFCVGLLGMTKPNLGVFAALAGWVSLSNLVAARTSRSVLFGAGALAALVLPFVLMRHNLPEAGSYCLLASGAILLLLAQLAMSEVNRSLSLRVFAAPVGGCFAAVLACAGYALAKGTSVGGLIHGLVLQHVGFDRAFFRWPSFGLENVLLSLMVASVVLVATGPSRRFRQKAPWASIVAKVSVALLVLWVALLGGPWDSPIFVWCLLLVAATGQLSARLPRSVWEAAPRQFAASLAILSALWGYPVWGLSQAALSFFLLLPVALVGCTDGLRYEGWLPGKALPLPRRKAIGRALSCLGALAIVGLGLICAHTAVRSYHRLEPSGLRGSHLLHIPREQADFYRRMIDAARAHGQSFFTMPGMGSLYFWAEADSPTCINATAWMTLLTPDQQLKVVADLQKTPDLSVIRFQPMVEFWTDGHDISGNKIVRYIEDNFVPVESFGGCDILVRRLPGS